MVHRVNGADGRSVAARYYSELVAPLLLQQWPGLRHAAGRLGSGSEVVGLDDQLSRDHDWGLRLTVLVDADMREAVAELLSRALPDSFDGLRTRLTFTGQSESVLAAEVETASDFVRSRLGLDPRSGMGSLDWLTVTGQAVLEVVAGPVFHDSAGEISDIRERLRWYPDDVWRYVIACDWARLAEEMPLMSRAGDRGDDLGSRVIAARLVDSAMHLGFMLERQWTPYSKWRGSMFARLPSMQPVRSALVATLQAGTWRERQACLGVAVDQLQRVQNARGLSSCPVAAVPFYDRPYIHIDGQIIDDLLSAITDPVLRRLPRGRGSIEQQSDNVALLVDPTARRAAMAFD
jgi:Domain of unknown function (DUF4037)